MITGTYDPVLSRVRINLINAHVADPFNRTAANGWDVADSFQIWTHTGGATSDYLVTGTAGRQVHTSVNVLRHSLIELGTPNMTVTAEPKFAGLPLGASISQVVAARASDAANSYQAQIQIAPSGAATLVLSKRVAGVGAALTTFPLGTHAAGQQWRIILDVQGSTLRAKAWRIGVDLATDWQVTGTDTDLTTGTMAGVFSRLDPGNTNTLPFNVDWEMFTAVPTTDVERSLDQITWTTVRGGASVTSNDLGGIALDDYEFTPGVPNHYRVAGDEVSVTPNMVGVWLKSVARPFLNRQVTILDYSDVSRPSRSGTFEVVGRSDPIAVNDLRGSPRWTLDVLAETAAEAESIDLLLASGDTLLVHTHAGCDVPGGYVTVGDTNVRRLSRQSARRGIAVPCTRSAAPGPDVVGAISNWQTVLNTYATWADVLAAHSSWSSLLELIGDPTDVVVQ